MVRPIPSHIDVGPTTPTTIRCGGGAADDAEDAIRMLSIGKSTPTTMASHHPDQGFLFKDLHARRQNSITGKTAAATLSFLRKRLLSVNLRSDLSSSSSSSLSLSSSGTGINDDDDSIVIAKEVFDKILDKHQMKDGKNNNNKQEPSRDVKKLRVKDKKNKNEKARKTTAGGKRSVRFNVDENNNIIPSIHEYESLVSASSGEDGGCEQDVFYTSKSEIQATKKQTRRDADEFLYSHEGWLDRFEDGFASPFNKNHLRRQNSMIEATKQQEQDTTETDVTSSSMEHLSERSGSSSSIHSMLDPTTDAIRTLCESTSRGLERRMSKMMQQHQRWATMTIVLRYRTLRSDEFDYVRCQNHHHHVADDAHTLDVAEQLRNRCLAVSKPARDLALKIGQQDQYVAMKIHNELLI